MPYAAPRPCPAPGCPELTNGGRCPAHRRARNAAMDARRGSPAERGYDRAWRRLRRLKLAAAPWCEIRTHCAKLSILERLATEVDHIESVRERPDLRLVWSNLRSACKRCHSARTMRDQVRGRRASSESEHVSKRERRGPVANFGASRCVPPGP